MNRFMVRVGMGILLVLAATNLTLAEFPVSIQSQQAPAMGQPIAWHNNLQSGWREAKRRNLPMLIFITADECVYCDAMKRDTWCEPSVKSRMSDKFVAIKLTKNVNVETLRRIKVDMYPLTLMGTPNGKIIGHRKGYQPPSALHGFISETKAIFERSRMTAKNIH